MSSTSVEPDLPLADEGLVRAHASELTMLAARYGISGLRYASAGRLVGHVADDRDMFDMVDFDLAATDLLGAKLSLLSDAVLRHPNVSEDLLEAHVL
jgi:hypothetical protein